MVVKWDPKAREIKILGRPIGKIKGLAERFKNYLSWFQLPLILYTAILSTIQYMPKIFAGHLPEMLIVGGVGFVIFALTVMYIDFKFYLSFQILLSQLPTLY